jgi:hypothetical protein
MFPNCPQYSITTSFEHNLFGRKMRYNPDLIVNEVESPMKELNEQMGMMNFDFTPNDADEKYRLLLFPRILLIIPFAGNARIRRHAQVDHSFQFEFLPVIRYRRRQCRVDWKNEIIFKMNLKIKLKSQVELQASSSKNSNVTHLAIAISINACML